MYSTVTLNITWSTNFNQYLSRTLQELRNSYASNMTYHSLPKYLKKKTHTHSSTLVWPISSIALLVNVHSCISPSKNQTKKIVYIQVYSEALVHHITTPSRSGINGRPHLEVKVRWDGSMPVKCTCKFTCTEMLYYYPGARSAKRGACVHRATSLRQNTFPVCIPISAIPSTKKYPQWPWLWFPLCSYAGPSKMCAQLTERFVYVMCECECVGISFLYTNSVWVFTGLHNVWVPCSLLIELLTDSC